MGFSVRESLDYQNTTQLKQFTTALKIGKNLTRKADLMDCLERQLIQNTGNVLQHLSQAEKLYLAELAHNGSCSPAKFTAKYKHDYPISQRWNTPKTIILLFVTDPLGIGTYSIPNELVDILRALLPKPPAITIETVPAIPPILKVTHNGKDPKERPMHIYTGEKTVFQEARRVLSLAQAGKLQVSDKSMNPTSATVKAVSGVLVQPDFFLELPESEPFSQMESSGAVRAYAWGVLMQQAGWCKSQKGKMILTPDGKKFFDKPNIEEYRQAIDQIIADDNFDELTRINHIRGQSGKAKQHLSYPSDRKFEIAKTMHDWPVNEWIQLSEAFRILHAIAQDYWIIEDGFYLYFGEQQYGHLSGREFLIGKQYFRVFLFETMATLGLIDVGYTYPHGLWLEFRDEWGNDAFDFCGRYDGLFFVRLNSLGAYCLGITDHYEIPSVEEPRTLKILPNHDIIFVGEDRTASADRPFLETIAARQGDYSWTLDKKRILNYLETGGSIEDIIAFLKNRSIEDLPENVYIFFRDIASKMGVFGEMEEAVLIEVKDSTVATLIAHSSSTKKYCLLTGNHHLTVRAKHLRTFREAIKKLGYTLS